LFSPFESWSPQDRQAIQKLLQDVYDRFVRRVAEGRDNLSIEEVRQAAQGRVWTGAQAHEKGLVDRIGGLPTAIEAAKRAAGLPPDQPVRVLQWPRPRSLVEVLLFGEDGDAAEPPYGGWAVARLLDGDGRLRAYLGALTAMREEAALCILPAIITVR
jgi:protease-4